MNSEYRSWFLAGPEQTRALRLFCFPYAGGSAAAYAKWRNLVDRDIEVVPIQLPGRGSRIREAPIDNIAELSAQLSDVLSSRLDLPCAFFGHSMGAVLAFETARTLRQRGLPLPRALFLSARRAPQRPATRPPLHGLPEPQLIAELRKLGGTPPEIFADEELLSLVLPVMRADLKAVETHAYRAEPPLDCPLWVFGGRQDSITEDDLRAWSEQSHGPFDLTMYEGGHFFLNDHAGAMLSRMAMVLKGEV